MMCVLHSFDRVTSCGFFIIVFVVLCERSFLILIIFMALSAQILLLATLDPHMPQIILLLVLRDTSIIVLN